MTKRSAVSRSRSIRPLALLSLVVATLALVGCGAGFDPPSELQSLRVLAVQKDKPYAERGETVTLTMAWHDGSPKVDPADPSKRPIQLGWYGPCVNPPLDSYASCGQAIARQLSNDDPGDDPTTGTGPTFQVTVPDRDDLLHPNQDPKQPPYALIYVFFVACAGEIGPPADPSFPASCYDPQTHEVLLSDDFVAGYSAIYVFGADRDYRNQNPVIQGFVAQSKDVKDVACIGDDCLGTCTEDGCHNPPPTATLDDAGTYCAAHPSLCVPTCKDDADPVKCTGYDLHPWLDPSTVEKDQVSNDAYGHDYTEQMWIDYYSSRGAMKSSTKLLNDATSGWNSGYGSSFLAPSSPGPVQIWAVVHDNRGGMSWAGVTLLVR